MRFLLLASLALLALLSAPLLARGSGVAAAVASAMPPMPTSVADAMANAPSHPLSEDDAFFLQLAQHVDNAAELEAQAEAELEAEEAAQAQAQAQAQTQTQTEVEAEAEAEADAESEFDLEDASFAELSAEADAALEAGLELEDGAEFEAQAVSEMEADLDAEAEAEAEAEADAETEAEEDAALVELSGDSVVDIGASHAAEELLAAEAEDDAHAARELHSLLDSSSSLDADSNPNALYHPKIVAPPAHQQRIMQQRAEVGHIKSLLARIDARTPRAAMPTEDEMLHRIVA